MKKILLLVGLFFITTLQGNPPYQGEINYNEEELTPRRKKELQKQESIGRTAIERQEKKERREQFKQEAVDRLRVYENDLAKEENKRAHEAYIKTLESHVLLAQRDYEKAEKARKKAPGNREKIKEAQYYQFQWERAQEKLDSALGIKKSQKPHWNKY